MRQIYLDHNASTPVAPAVLAAMHPYFLGEFGNPSSGHWASHEAKRGLEKAREQVASLLKCHRDEVYFTSGGTEANNMAIKGIWFDRRRRGDHIITSAIEHDAVRAPLRFLRRMGAKVTVLPVDQWGRVDPQDVQKAIRPQTCLITIMHANNETGTVQPIKEIAKIAAEYGIPMHTDAAQSAGKISTHVNALGVDMLSLAGHKFYAPKGVGALYIRSGLKLESYAHGAGHENGHRAGTESALLTSGLGAACALAQKESPKRIEELRDYFWEQLKANLGEKVSRNGHAEHVVPNTLNISIANQVGAEILAKLDGVAAATGSACHAGCVDMSPVLIAMRTPLHIGMGAIRFSLGKQNTSDEIDHVVQRMKAIVN